MKNILIAGIGAAMVSLAAHAALKQGERAPQFTTQASLNGKAFTYSLGDALKKGPVVVYFYPSAYTGGCNLQAHTFAINNSKFKAAGASIVGVSLDSIDRLNAFSADPEYCAGEFPTASDPGGKISSSFGLKVTDAKPGFKDSRGDAIDHGFAERTTFVVTPDGQIAAVIGGVSPADNVNQALAAVQRLEPSK